MLSDSLSRGEVHPPRETIREAEVARTAHKVFHLLRPEKGEHKSGFDNLVLFIRLLHSAARKAAFLFSVLSHDAIILVLDEMYNRTFGCIPFFCVL